MRLPTTDTDSYRIRRDILYDNQHSTAMNCLDHGTLALVLVFRTTGKRKENHVYILRRGQFPTRITVVSWTDPCRRCTRCRPERMGAGRTEGRRGKKAVRLRGEGDGNCGDALNAPL